MWKSLSSGDVLGWEIELSGETLAFSQVTKPRRDEAVVALWIWG